MTQERLVCLAGERLPISMTVLSRPSAMVFVHGTILECRRGRRSVGVEHAGG
jgi:hypothetical protein